MVRKKIAVLTDDEIEILKRGRKDPSIASNYFFCGKGREQGWIFDYKFDPEGAWQNIVHKATQKRILLIGGFGCGKTRGVGVSAALWSMMTMDFAFMNCAPKAWQSELMYNFLIQISRNTPFAKLIYSKPKRPYPKIELQFYVDDVLVVSTMEFMSVDKNADAILGWEGDWANVDEAGQIDDLEETVRNLGTRMRGSVNGRPRLGRLSMTSNSWENPYMWYRYDLAAELPKDYLSLTVSSRHNHNITADQLRLMLKDVPEDEHERFIDGARPEGRGMYFSKPRVYACENKVYGDLILSAYKQKKVGFELVTAHGCGVTYYTFPKQAKHEYMILGDPGTGNAPNRNAPAIQVWDVTDFPKFKANMVCLWWGSGDGDITPFINRLLRLMEMYDPIHTAIDSTGTQKSAAQLLNTYLMAERSDPGKLPEWFLDVDLSKVTNANIGGMDFSGGRKPAYLTAGRLMIEANLMIWPKFVVGMRSQLTNYDPAKDRSDATSKIPQDLVATFCMSAYAIRTWFHLDPSSAGTSSEKENIDEDDKRLAREARLTGEARSRQNPRAGLGSEYEESREKRPIQ